MAVASSSTVALSLRVRVSWDTQQRLPYNRNAPRKIKTNPDGLSLATATSRSSSILTSTSTSTTSTATTTLKEMDVHQLLSIKIPKPTEVNMDESTYLGYERWLPSAPKVEKPRSVFNAATLAYVGDCIYELYARRHFLSPALNIEECNHRVMAVVRCEAQDALLQKLLNDNLLTEEERDVLRWGKNIISAKTKTKKRAGVAVYNRASSLETLVGYLYLTNVKRLEDVMSKLGFSVGTSNQSILEDLSRKLQNMKQKKQSDHMQMQ